MSGYVSDTSCRQDPVRYRILRERLAQQDIDGHADYIARDRPLSALEFVDAVERAFARLAEMPSNSRR